MPVYFEEFPVNFINGDDGGVYYVDKIMSWSDVPWRLDEVKSFMENKRGKSGLQPYSDNEIRRVETSIKRLGELGMPVV